MEILVHAQFSNIELAMSRLNSFRQRYKKQLIDQAYCRKGVLIITIRFAGLFLSYTILWNLLRSTGNGLRQGSNLYGNGF